MKIRSFVGIILFLCFVQVTRCRLYMNDGDVETGAGSKKLKQVETIIK